MSIYYYALNNQQDYVFDNFPPELVSLISDFRESQKIIEVVIDEKIKKARIGRKKNCDGEIYVLTTLEKYINRYKSFKELVNFSGIALAPLTKLQNDIIEKQNKRTEEFIHNVTSLNTYGIQDLFSLVPQEILAKNINKQNDIIKDILVEKPNIAVKTLLKLIKYNLAMKVEFSVFERTLSPYGYVQKIEHSIRNLILSILQIFMDDLVEKKIEVSLEASEKRLSIDYDSIFVSLFYLFDNATKYCCPNSKLKINFNEEKDSFDVVLKMLSLRIEDSEVKKLTLRSYRASNAQKLNKEGRGIGMYRILKTLKLNNAELEIIPRSYDNARIVSGHCYESNMFKLKFLGQQDWFKTNL